LALRSKPKIKVIEEEILIIAQLLVFFFLLWCSGSFNKIIKGWLDNDIQGSSIMYFIYFLLILRGKKLKEMIFSCVLGEKTLWNHTMFSFYLVYFFQPLGIFLSLLIWSFYIRLIWDWDSMLVLFGLVLATRSVEKQNHTSIDAWFNKIKWN
jgi:hypothetical protein